MVFDEVGWSADSDRGGESELAIAIGQGGRPFSA